MRIAVMSASGLDFAIGRNGLYIEPDLESRDTYRHGCKIANCAGEGRCAYTTRAELAFAHLLTNDIANGGTYTLAGAAITQVRLTDDINSVDGTQLVYEAMSVPDDLTERRAELGEYLGTIIGGNYEGIALSAMDVFSDFAAAAGREHVAWADAFSNLTS